MDLKPYEYRRIIESYSVGTLRKMLDIMTTPLRTLKVCEIVSACADEAQELAREIKADLRHGALARDEQ